MALDSIAQNRQAADAMTRQSLIASGTAAGRTIRTLRYCKEDRRADAYRDAILARMAPFGTYGQIMVSTADAVAAEGVDMARKPKGFSCARHSKDFDAAFAKMAAR
jgi:hypothetical protein